MTPRFSASAPLDDFDNEVAALSRRYRSGRTALSFEVIPPRHDADAAKIDNLLRTLESYRPDYIAVTSSQRSGWLRGTADFIAQISQQTRMRPLAHLACTAGPTEELEDWIEALIDAGVRGFLALRGDFAEGQTHLPEGYMQHADALVRLIRQHEACQSARFAAGRLAIGVASYPTGHAESANYDEDLDVLLAKQRAGADLAISQLFFDAEDYLRFSERARLAGIRMTLVPGVMPITSLRRLQRMSELSGQPIPERVAKRLAQARSPDEEREIGMELTTQLARSIIDGGVGSLHLYTHNSTDVTTELLDRLDIHPHKPH